MPDIHTEISFRTARSGGKGGQNVNKVETMVEGYWNIEHSSFFSIEEKKRLLAKLSNKINADGFLLVKSQADRTQLGNKQQVILKMNTLVKNALVIAKVRKPTRPDIASKQARLESKKKTGTIKQSRKKITGNE